MASREGGMGCRFVFFWTREDYDRQAVSSPKTRERERDGKNAESKKTSIYLEQLRRPGAEAVGLPEVEGAEVRVERLVDLVGVWEEKGGERKKDEVSVKRTTPRDFSERERDAKGTRTKNEREIKRIKKSFSPAPCRSSRSGSPSRAWRRRMRPRRGRRRAGSGS